MMPWPPRGDTPIDWGDEPVEPPPPPTASRSIRLAFSAVYDYAGSAITASILAFVVFFSAFSVLYQGMMLLGRGRRADGVFLLGLMLLLSPLVIGPLLAGLFTLASAMFRHDDPHLFDIWRGARRFARPAWALAYVQALITTVLLSDVAYLLARPEAALKVAAVLVAYVLLFWGMMLTYQWGLLVEQGTPLFTTLRRSTLLAAANPFYTVAITLLVGALLLFPVAALFASRYGPVVLVPVSVLWGMLLPGIQTSATLEILRKYDAPEDGGPDGNGPDEAGSDEAGLNESGPDGNGAPEGF